MQQAAPLQAMVRDVLVRGDKDGVTAEDGVAVVAMVVDGVAAIGGLAPDIFRQEFVLGPFPIGRAVFKSKELP